MREILFRAKRIDNGEWVEGCLITRKYAQTNEVYEAHIVEDAYEQLGVLGYGIHPVLISPLADEYVDGCFRVDIKTICQYTGLTDKNGNKIWENDVVVRVDRRNGIYVFREQPTMNCKVVWTDRHGFDTSPSCGYFDTKNARECEVIGNIFDNPELLGE